MTEKRQVPFTQYILPDGKKAAMVVWMPAEVADKADKIIAAGFCFEAEVLTTGMVSLTIADEYQDHAIQLCANGPVVLDAVKKLITSFNIEEAKQAQCA